MAVDAPKNRGMIAGDAVEILSGRQNLLGPLGVIPSATEEPLSRGRGPGVLGDTLLHLCKGLGANQINLHLLEAAAAQVEMGIVETRHDETSAQIDNRGFR